MYQPCFAVYIREAQERSFVMPTLSDIANISTAAAVAFAAWQIRLSKKQAATTFEDSLAKEYRELAAQLPTKALLGEMLTDSEHAASFDEMYQYFDLCNQQAFLADAGRISKKTWKFWKDGIESNLKRPAFERAWSEIAARSSGDFTELRALFPPKSQVQPNASGSTIHSSRRRFAARLNSSVRKKCLKHIT